MAIFAEVTENEYIIHRHLRDIDLAIQWDDVYTLLFRPDSTDGATVLLLYDGVLCTRFSLHLGRYLKILSSKPTTHDGRAVVCATA